MRLGSGLAQKGLLEMGPFLKNPPEVPEKIKILNILENSQTVEEKETPTIF